MELFVFLFSKMQKADCRKWQNEFYEKTEFEEGQEISSNGSSKNDVIALGDGFMT